MMTAVKSIVRNVDPDVVNYLEEMLRDAKDGKITGFAAVSRSNGACEFTNAGIPNRFELTGYLTHLIYKLQSTE